MSPSLGRLVVAFAGIVNAVAATRLAVNTNAPAFPTVNYTKLGLSGHPVQRKTSRWLTDFAKPTNVWWVTLGIDDGGGQFTPFPYSMEQWSSGMRVCAPTMATDTGAVNMNCYR